MIEFRGVGQEVHLVLYVLDLVTVGRASQGGRYELKPFGSDLKSKRLRKRIVYGISNIR